MRVLCCREIQKSIKESVKQLIEDKIIACGFGPLNGDGFFRATETEITGRNGTWFGFAGLRTNPESVKSKEGIDLALVEEASTVSARSIKILTPTIRKPGSEAWWVWNPKSESDPVDEMFRGKAGTPPRSVVREINYYDNPFFPDVLKEEMEWDLRRDPELHAHVWLGKYELRSEGRVFKNWAVEDFETPADAEFYFGADFGFSVDPSTLLRIFLRGRKLYIDHEAYKVGCEIDETPALFAGSDMRDPPRWNNKHNHPGIPGATKWTIRADSARPETISYLNARGFRVVPAIKGAGSIEEGVEFLKTYDIVIHPRCKNTIREFTFYRYKLDKLTGRVLPLLEDADNNLIDPARYALEEVRRARPVQVFF